MRMPWRKRRRRRPVRYQAAKSGGIGDALREARTRHGLTQEELAKQTRVGRTQIAQVERGHAMPSVQLVEEVADALAVGFLYVGGRGWVIQL